MSVSKMTGLQAFSHMKQLMVSHAKGFQGYCHRTCQNAWGLPARNASAIDAWGAVPKADRHTDAAKAPIGAPHFFSGGAYGHVVLQSDKKGIVISTDAPTTDYVGEVPLTWFTTHWGKHYLGWASSYNGVTLQLKEMPN